jgi:hypothetical protein
MNDCPATSMVTAKTSVSSALANWDISFGKIRTFQQKPDCQFAGTGKVPRGVRTAL